MVLCARRLPQYGRIFCDDVLWPANFWLERSERRFFLIGEDGRALIAGGASGLNEDAHLGARDAENEPVSFESEILVACALVANLLR